MQAHIVPLRTYFLVFTALLVGTAATVGAAYVDLGRFNIVVALAIACVKASLVVLFFMHLIYSSKLTKTIFICGLATLMILFFFTLLDLISRGFVGNSPWLNVPGR